MLARSLARSPAGAKAHPRVPARAPAVARLTHQRHLVSAFNRRVVAVKAEIGLGYKMTDCPEYFRVLQRSDGGSVSLSSFKGKQPVVLFFYPKAGTPGCTKEACAFRDSYKAFEDAGAAVFGISSDSPADNAKWAKDNNLPFPLLSDTSSILRKVFGIKGDLLGLLPGRQTYVISADGKVVSVFNSQLDVEKHISTSLEALSRLPASTKA